MLFIILLFNEMLLKGFKQERYVVSQNTKSALATVGRLETTVSPSTVRGR